MSEMTTGAPAARSRAAWALLGAFVLGLVCGAALLLLGQRSVVGPPHPPPGPQSVARPLEHMARTLELDPEQRREVRAILERNRDRMHDLLEESRLEIRAVLRPDQQERFDRMRPEPRGRRRDRPREPRR